MSHSVQHPELPAYSILHNLSSGILVSDGESPSHPIVYVNKAFENITGYTAEEVLGHNGQILHGPDTDPAEVELMTCAMQDGRSYRGLVLNYKRDGTPFWNGVVLDPVRDTNGKITRFVETISDVTSSREQLRALAARLTEVREEERRVISRDIHDQLGQALTGLKLDVSWVQRRLNQELSPDEIATVCTRLKEMSEDIDNTIKTVRRIATQLRPPLLDDLGLEAAIEWQLNEFGERSGLQCHFVSTIENDVLQAEHTTTLFRILQESLTNVMRHANATQVDVVLEVRDGQACLEITDNGRGIRDMDTVNLKSIGLLGMRERAALVGGKVEVRGHKHQGTSVLAQIPIPDSPSQQNSQHQDWEANLA